MIREDEVGVVEMKDFIVALPLDVLQKLIKKRDYEDAIQWAQKHGGVAFHLSCPYQDVKAVKKYIIGETSNGKVLNEVVEFKLETSGKAQRYLLEKELTDDEFIGQRLKDEGIKGTTNILPKVREFRDEWERTLA